MTHQSHISLGAVFCFAAFDFAILSEPIGPSSRRSPFVISEIMYHPSEHPGGDDLEFVEIYNSQPWSEDISGFRLSGGIEYSIPDDTILAENAFLVVAKSPGIIEAIHGIQEVLGPFSGKLNDSGDTLRLLNKSGAVLWETQYESSHPWPQAASELGHSLILHRPSYGERDYRAWSASVLPGGSPGRDVDASTEVPDPLHLPAGPNNDPAAENTIVINEIMYHPISEDSSDEYVELYNRGAVAVTLDEWRLTDGIRFSFPTQTVIKPEEFLVVASDLTRLTVRYPHLAIDHIVGNYDGRLSNSGERIALIRPVNSVDADTGRSRTDWITVDEVTYKDGGRWGEWSDGGGSSLELRDPRSDNRLAPNWADSDETTKGNWTLFEFSAELDNFAPASSVAGSRNNLHVIALGAGEYLIDDLEFRLDGGDNEVLNPSFSDGIDGWIGQGNHQEISFEPSGFSDNSSLKLRTTGRGDPGPNRLLTRLKNTFRSRQTGTLRARAKWRRGHPEILLRLNGNYLEAFGKLDVPDSLGTPSLPNSQLVINAGPAITEVCHVPILPSDNEPVLITAKVSDSDGLSNVFLRYRADPEQEMAAIEMNDAGTSGDAAANDGIFSAQIPGQSAGTLIAFHVTASDGAQPIENSSFPIDAPQRECLIRFGESVTGGQFGNYRMWMTRAVFQEWTRREKNSNQPLDITFVYGDFRVIYNAEAYFAGSVFNSPNYTTPSGQPCDYNVIFPKDDKMLGETDMTLSWPGLTSFPDPAAQSEQAAYWIANRLGLPFNYRRYVVVHVNGVRRNGRSILEDTQQPSRDLVAQWFSELAEGDLYKMQTKYELNETASASSGLSSTLVNLEIPTMEQRHARYRWNWGKRAVDGSMNDYETLFELLETMNLPDQDFYTERVSGLADVAQWMRILAVERCMGNWDSFGYANGQNMYFYKPDDGRWKLLIWDMDFELGGFIADPPFTSIFTHSTSIFPGLTVDASTRRFFRHPEFRRSYLRAMQAALDGPLAESDTFLRTKFAALRDNGISVSSPTRAIAYLNQRRSAVDSQLNQFRVPFELTHPDSPFDETDLAYVPFAGTAPYGVDYIKVNGVPFPTRWPDEDKWEIEVPITTLEATFEIQGFDDQGTPIEEALASITLRYTGPSPIPTPTLWINEWQASNESAVLDPVDQDFEDWFEIYNPNAYEIDLYGFGLSDSTENPFRFVVPTHSVVPAGGYLMVWADGEPSQTYVSGSPPGAPTELHTSFQLRRAGETLVITAPDGRLVDSVSFPAQTTDISQGRQPDGAPPPYVFMSDPTPGQSNFIQEDALRVSIIRRLSADTLEIAWEGTPGAAYQIQFKEALDQTQWTPVDELTADDRLVTYPISTLGKPTGFYRLLRTNDPPIP